MGIGFLTADSGDEIPGEYNASGSIQNDIITILESDGQVTGETHCEGGDRFTPERGRHTINRLQKATIRTPILFVLNRPEVIRGAIL